MCSQVLSYVLSASAESSDQHRKNKQQMKPVCISELKARSTELCGNPSSTKKRDEHTVASEKVSQSRRSTVVTSAGRKNATRRSDIRGRAAAGMSILKAGHMSLMYKGQLVS